MPDHDGYPTDEEVARIREWPYAAGVARWFEYIRGCWNMADWGWEDTLVNSDPPSYIYRISTGGWSGNEEIINAMQDNRMLWALTWWSTRRGGHYEFRVGEKAHDAE